MRLIEGVKFASTNSEIKYKNRDDLSLVVFDEETSVAGVFTKSNIVSSTVTWCRKSLENKKAKALIVNAGNANTFTGEAGEEIVQKTAEEISKSLNCDKNKVFISSTGVIGEIFDYKLITTKITGLINNLNNDEPSFRACAKAIMTTDLVEKISYKEVLIDGEKIIIQGFCKGSGMIAPNMATMLSYIFTDAKISSKDLQEITNEINEKSFNSITVDSDCSTNDTSMVFATNKSGSLIQKGNNSYEVFKKSLLAVLLDLAKKIVKDGEGAKKLIKVTVSGARSIDQAKKSAFAVANSPLVKSAIAAFDPNWGRIIMAIGKSQVEINHKNLRLSIGANIIVENGQKSGDYDEEKIRNYIENNQEIAIDINLANSENNSWTSYGCDLNEEYVTINKEYRT